MMDITRVGVIGGGLMGAGIAEVSARAGCDVIVLEATAEFAAAARERIAASLDRAAKKGTIDEAARDAALARVRVTTDIADLADRQLTIEAIIEDEAAKLDVFRRLDAVLADPDAILASNTSSIPITRLAAATSRPDHVIGMHFFSPVPVMRLAELVVSLTTSDDTVARAEVFAANVLGKRVIRSQDRAGFIVNALFVPFIIAAIRMYESGFASAEDIDNGMVEGCNHPVGPLRLADAIGLDTIKAVGDSLYAEFKESLYAPPPLLARMVEAGHLGRKTKRGFYTY